MLEIFKKIDVTKVLFWDIETRPQVEKLDKESQLMEWLEYTNRYKKKELEPYDGDLTRFYDDKAALFPEAGAICAISIGFISGDKLRTTSFYGEDEKTILVNFLGFLREVQDKFPVLCDFAGTVFDRPYVILRAMSHGITDIPKILDEPTEPWNRTNIDLKDLSRFGRFSPSSLLGLCTILGIPSPKEDICGADVRDAFFRGEHDRIKDYCEKDVHRTALSLLRMMGLPDVKPVSIEMTRDYTIYEDTTNFLDTYIKDGELDIKTASVQIASLSEEEQSIALRLIEIIK